LQQADKSYHPFLYSLTSYLSHPIGVKMGYEPRYTLAPCFPVAPNILLTAAHAIYPEEHINAGYENFLIESRQPHLSQRSTCTHIQNPSKKALQEKDPVSNEDWLLARDYAFLHVAQPVSNFLIPKAAREGDDIVFSCPRPAISPQDLDVITDIKFALYVAYQYGGSISDAEAWKRAQETKINSEVLQSLLGSADLIQGTGKVLKLAHGLMAHNSPFFCGMSGAFGSVAPGTFSCIGISAGTGVTSPGTNYNVALDICREDFKQDYAKIVLPTLPNNIWPEVEKFIKAK